MIYVLYDVVNLLYRTKEGHAAGSLSDMNIILKRHAASDVACASSVAPPLL